MTTIDYPQLYIDGTWTAPAGHDTIEVHSPATEERIGSVPRGNEADIDAAVAAARAAFDAPDGWSTWHPKERADVLERFAAELEARGAETARRVSMQNGMPIWLAQQFRGRVSAATAALLQRPDDECTSRGIASRHVRRHLAGV